MVSTATSPGGGGSNARRGTASVVVTENTADHLEASAPRPALQRAATWRGTTRSARTNDPAGSHSVRSSVVVIENGGLATTRNGARGSTSAVASCSTTRTADPKRRLNPAARRGCSSTASTRAPARTSGAVMAPAPAPRSTTRSPGEIPARSTRRHAHSSSSRCHPHHVRADADTTHHRHDHLLIVTARPPPQQASFPSPTPASARVMPITTAFNHNATLTTDLDRFVEWYGEVFDAVVTFTMDATADHHA
jgi:hypothetical protein